MMREFIRNEKMSNGINYSHSQNIHTLHGPSQILPIILEKYSPKSALDVGCGIGTWLKVIGDLGLNDILGIDGIAIQDSELLISNDKFLQVDLCQSWDLGRRFDLVLCLEVAEHLPENSANLLVHSLTMHSDLIVFSAACPNQFGQGHINCQWPIYWQKLFNSYNYSCFDELRALIWDLDFPEFWYKQNIFVAKKSTQSSCKENSISSIVHPDLYFSYVARWNYAERLIQGEMGFGTHSKIFLKALAKLIARVSTVAAK